MASVSSSGDAEAPTSYSRKWNWSTNWNESGGYTSGYRGHSSESNSYNNHSDSRAATDWKESSPPCNSRRGDADSKYTSNTTWRSQQGPHDTPADMGKRKTGTWESAECV